MICYNCGCSLSEKNFCTSCRADVTIYKKIMYTANRFYNDGLEKANVRDLAGAVSSLRQCLRLNKDHIEARNLLGLVYFERGEVVAALSEWIISKNIRGEKNIADDYINIVQKNPGRLEAFNQTVKKYNQALLYCQQDSLDLAVIQLKKVISMNSRFVQAYQLLALLYINAQEWDKAKKVLMQCQEIDTNNTMTLRYMKEVDANLTTEEEKPKKKKETIVYQSGNDTVIQPISKKENIAFKTLLNIVLGAALGVAITWYLVVPAKEQEVQQSAKEEIRIISEQLDVKTLQVTELTQKVDSLTLEKDSLTTSLGVAQSTNQVVEAYTDLIEAAVMYIESGENAETAIAVAEVLEAIELNYATVDTSEGYKALQQLLVEEISPVIAEECYTTGYAAYKAADYQTAIADLERAFKYDATNKDALYFLGQSYYKSGDTVNALPIYEQIIELFPDTNRAASAAKRIREIQG
ncbi:MAG: tetratricopeptide repeat protein [Lachnospiraceae bacterium]|nr:tetratricopeptide repeat protein [Lachnospiraceae bacterium]